MTEAGLEPPGGTATQPVPVELRWHVSTKVVAEGLTAALALLAAAVTGDAVLVAFATPLALAAVFGLTRRAPRAPSLGLAVSPLVGSPHQPVDVVISIHCTVATICRLVLAVPKGMTPEGPTSWTIRVHAGRTAEVSCRMRTGRVGRFRLGSLAVTVTDAASALVGTGATEGAIVVESRPLPQALKTLVRPERVRATAGDRVARLGGDGIEFAEVREEMAGSLERRINWRATARRGTPCVNVQHPERSTDVVLLADTFTEAQLPAVVSVSVALADTYLGRHDRVGLVAFGGILDWVEPGTGPSHLERIRRALLSSEAYFSYAWKTADVIPRRLFPAGCLVLAVTPLGDERFRTTLAALRSRGTELAIIELEPAWPEGGFRSGAGTLARRIVTMERHEQRRQFWQLGVPVATVQGPEGIRAGLAEIAAFRRAMRGQVSARPAAGLGR